MEARWALPRRSEGDLRGPWQIVQPLLPVAPVPGDPLGPRVVRFLDGAQRQDVVAEGDVQRPEVLLGCEVQAHELIDECRDTARISDKQVD